ncbi:MAG: glucosyl-3-phosphoglycerate synthase [Actinobacteria bacterium]|jgi:glucosyl-3-phosphoglycerate synthase|nr:MAG: glucosyl-3-phosphoglycerate synthase [Actinomycetota bacterium]
MADGVMGGNGECYEVTRLEKCDWYDANTFHHEDFGDIGGLLEAKQRAGKSISVCLPSMNEADTIGTILETARLELMEKVPLVDQLCVVDGGSEDATRDIARDAGAEVFGQEEILPGRYEPMGKGDALWRSLLCLRGDIIVWIDSDIRNFHPRFIYGIIGPLIARPGIRYVKGYYQRPIKAEHRLLSTGGGRVTELVARPLLSLFFPELGALIQPLSGEYGGDRELLEKIPFFSGYGVEIGMLMDIYSRFGMDVIGQVDLVERQHFNQPMSALGGMSFQIMQAVFIRLQEQGKLELLQEYSTEMTRVDYINGEYLLEKKMLQVEERPPMVELKEYRDIFGRDG